VTVTVGSGASSAVVVASDKRKVWVVSDDPERKVSVRFDEAVVMAAVVVAAVDGGGGRDKTEVMTMTMTTRQSDVIVLERDMGRMILEE